MNYNDYDKLVDKHFSSLESVDYELTDYSFDIDHYGNSIDITVDDFTVRPNLPLLEDDYLIIEKEDLNKFCDELVKQEVEPQIPYATIHKAVVDALLGCIVLEKTYDKWEEICYEDLASAVIEQLTKD